MSDDRKLKASEIESVLMHCFRAKRPAFIWGPPGIGKSELIEGITKKLNGAMYDLRLGQMEPTDIRGIPFYNRDDQVMDWAQPIDLPQGQQLLVDAIKTGTIDMETKLSEGAKVEDLPVVVLFLDEMNSAPPSVLAAAYQLILNRRIGKYRLPDNVVVVAAGNRESDKGVTFRMPSPLSNRFVHFEMKVDFEDWFNWAVTNNIHQDIIGYLNFAKGDLNKFEATSASRAFATPRSWSFVNDLINGVEMPDTVMTELIAGTVGEGMAVKFMAYRKISKDMPNPTEILNGTVKTLKTKEISAMYSLVIGMCYELKEAVTNKIKEKEFHDMVINFFDFMMANFNKEIAVMGARVALVVYELPIKPLKLGKSFKQFHEEYGHYIAAAKT